MSPASEVPPSLGAGSMVEELDRDRPLFNDEVQVQVKFPDHDKTLALTVRVLQGSRLAPVGSGGGQREGVLHIEVTDELDPFFLYTLQVRLFFDVCNVCFVLWISTFETVPGF